MMRYLSAGLHPYSFERAYRATQRNFITHYILRNFLELPWSCLASLSDQEKYDIVSAFLTGFWYVADYSHCDDLITALSLELGTPGCAAPRNTRVELERRVKWRYLDVADLSSDVVAQIQRENLLDQRLWETWREARHNTADVCPRALEGRSAGAFVSTEATRLVNQLARRILRRWGAWDADLPETWTALPEADSARFALTER
jgi:hypothetical protein